MYLTMAAFTLCEVFESERACWLVKQNEELKANIHEDAVADNK